MNLDQKYRKENTADDLIIKKQVVQCSEKAVIIPTLRPGETITMGDPPQIPVVSHEIERIARILHDSRQAINEQCVAEGIDYYSTDAWDALPESVQYRLLLQADWIMQRYEIKESCNSDSRAEKSRVRARIYKKRIADLEAAIKASAQMHREAIENQEKAHRMIIAQDFVQHQQDLQTWKDRAKRYLNDCISLEGQVECLQYRIDRIMELVERPPVVDSIRAILTEPPAETHHAEGIENR